MLSDHGPDLGDILDNPDVLAAWFADRILTERAFAQPMFHGLIYVDCDRTPATMVAVLATWFAAALTKIFDFEGRISRPVTIGPMDASRGVFREALWDASPVHKREHEFPYNLGPWASGHFKLW